MGGAARVKAAQNTELAVQRIFGWVSRICARCTHAQAGAAPSPWTVQAPLGHKMTVPASSTPHLLPVRAPREAPEEAFFGALRAKGSATRLRSPSRAYRPANSLADTSVSKFVTGSAGDTVADTDVDTPALAPAGEPPTPAESRSVEPTICFTLPLWMSMHGRNCTARRPDDGAALARADMREGRVVDERIAPPGLRLRRCRDWLSVSVKEAIYQGPLQSARAGNGS